MGCAASSRAKVAEPQPVDSSPNNTQPVPTRNNSPLQHPASASSKQAILSQSAEHQNPSGVEDSEGSECHLSGAATPAIGGSPRDSHEEKAGRSAVEVEGAGRIDVSEENAHSQRDLEASSASVGAAPASNRAVETEASNAHEKSKTDIEELANASFDQQAGEQQGVSEIESAFNPLMQSGVLLLEDACLPASEQLERILSQPDMTDIQIKGCKVDGESFRTICRVVKDRKVRGLTLARCNAADDVAEELAAFLTGRGGEGEEEEEKSTVLQLGLDGNEGISDRGATALATCLTHNSSLTELSLWGTGLGDAGATALASALASNHTLKQLWLGECDGVTDAGAAAFRESLATNTSLQQLGLVCTQVSDTVQNELEELVQSQRGHVAP